MGNNSSTESGWLVPLGNGPDYDATLETQLSGWLTGLTGLADGYVVSRWQPNQGPAFAADINWCAFGIVEISQDDSQAFVDQTDSSTQLWRHEVISLQTSFYGPGGQQLISQFRDGMAVNQNNDELNAQGLSLTDYSAIKSNPELIDTQWTRRYDMTVRLRRKVVREYGVNSLVDTPVSFFGE